MASTTIAYSTKDNAWTTRYSFIPTCYGVIDKKFVSCKTKIDEVTTEPLKSFWVHKESSENPSGNNIFYGDAYPTSITVSANNNPSGNKIFKALSLETNVDEWAFSFITDKDFDDNENQLAFISPTKMDVREGNRYIAVPRSQIWSSNNSVYIGILETAVAGQVRLNSHPPSPVMFGSYSFLTTYDVSTGKLMGFNRQGQPSPLIGLGNDAIKATSYDQETNTLTLDTQVSISSLGLSLFITTPSKIDGDFLRGKSCLITMSCAAPSIPSKPRLELYSIGVEYEFSNLDSRLG